MSDITVDNLDELQKRLARLSNPAFAQQIGQRAGRKIGEQLRYYLVKYPGASHSPVIWASRKQRAWYFANRQEMGLPLEYTRTSDPMSQKLGQSWTVAATSDGAIVGTRATYAPYVQSAAQQSAQHAATGWKTDVDAVGELERSKLIERIVLAEIDSLVKEMMR